MPTATATKASISDQVIESLETQSPKRKTLIRNFGNWILEELTRLEIDTDKPQDFVTKLDETLPLLESMWEVCGAIEATDSTNLFGEFAPMFENILQHYDVRPETGLFGHRETTFDWWKFHGNELMLLPVAAMLRGRCYDDLGAFLDHMYVQNMWSQKGSRSNFDFRSFATYIRILDDWNESNPRQLFNPPGHIINDRLQQYAPHDANLFRDTDMLLSLISASRADSDYRKRWWPELCFYSQNVPKFLNLASSEQEALKLAPLFREKGIAALQDKIRDSYAKVEKLRAKSDHRVFDVASLTNAIGTRP